MASRVRRQGETAYARHQRKVSKDARAAEKNQGIRRSVAVVGKCGAKKRGGGTCGMSKGWGTDHPGIGKCKLHGGNLPTHRGSAVKQQAVLLGAPKEINPLDAIIWCIKMTAGEIEFYTDQMAELHKEKWLEDTALGKQLHVFARERGIAQERLVNFSKVAISLGLTERAVRLAEQYGTTIATLLRGVLNDLEPYISDEGKKLVPQILRTHLLIAERGQEKVTEFAQNQTRKELNA